MTAWLRSPWRPFALLAGLALITSSPTAQAQWADQRFQYRVPVTVSNATSHGFAAGELVTATVPAAGISDALRKDAADASLYYNATPVPSRVLPMGGSLKVIFPLHAALASPGTYALTENQSAGKTDYNSLPAGTAVTFNDFNNANVVLTLPFTFPFRNIRTNKLLVAIDGYMAPGTLDPWRTDTAEATLSKNIIMPWTSDFVVDNTSGPASGVYADLSNPNQVTIRWELKDYARPGSLVAKFAAILYPNGNIRYVYSDTVTQDFSYVTWTSGAKVGVGVADPALSILNTVAGPVADFSNHDDILYTQTIPAATTQSGYYLYYGAPSISQAPALPAGVQGWNFADGQTHGWVSLQDPTGNADLTSVTDPVVGDKALHLGTSLFGVPMAVAAGMTPVGPQTVYTNLRQAGKTGSDATSVVTMRFNTQQMTDLNGITYLTHAEPPGTGIGFNWGGYAAMPATTALRGPDPGLAGREYPDFRAINGDAWFLNFLDDVTLSQYYVTATLDADGASFVTGKAWQARFDDPNPAGDPLVGGYPYLWDTTPASGGPLGTGINGLAIHSPGVYLKWMYVVPNGWADFVGTTAAAAETAPLPGAGFAVLQGVAYDASVGATAPLAGITVTVKDAGGATLASSVTDASGRYRLVVTASPAASNLTIRGVAAGRIGQVTQSVVENTVYNVNLPVAFGARAQGIVYDPQTNGGIPGATVQFRTPGTTTVLYTGTTNAAGQYQVDLDDPGTYDVVFAAPGFTSQTLAGKSYAGNAVTSADVSLVAAELLNNGGFETGTDIPTGWTPRSYDGSSTAVSTSEAALDSSSGTDLFYYISNPARAHSGSRFVAIKKTAVSVESWENAAGNLPAVEPGLLYRVSGWMKPTLGFDARLSLRFPTSTDPTGSVDGLGYSFETDNTSTAWQQIQRVIAPPAAQRYLTFRALGIAPGANANPGTVLVDDLSVKAVAPRLLTGKVVDASGAGVGGVGVGAAIGRNGLANPEAATTTDSNGNFTLMLPGKGMYNVQAWQWGGMAGPQVTVDTAASYQPLAPITLQAPVVPAFNLAQAATPTLADASGSKPHEFGNGPASMVFDNQLLYRYAMWSDWRSIPITNREQTLPITVTADLGRAYTFSQVSLAWELRAAGDAAGDFDVQVSSDNSTWTTVYSANGLGANYWPMTSNIKLQALQFDPVTARYVRLVLKSLPAAGAMDPKNDLSIIDLADIRVDVPGGPVSGIVQNAERQPQANAFVGVKSATGAIQWLAQTNASGAFSTILPAGIPSGVVAHLVLDAENVVAVSSPVSVTASAGLPTTMTPIVLGNTAPNLIGAAASATTISGGNDENPPVLAVDRNFGSWWANNYGTDAFGNPYTATPDNPASLIVDMGSSVTFNHINVVFKNVWTPDFQVDSSTDGATWTKLYETSSFVGLNNGPGDWAPYEPIQTPVTTARYLRFTSRYTNHNYTAVAEIQVANVPANPVQPYDLTRQALKIAAGLAAAQPSDLTSLNVANTGTSAGKVDLVDAVTLARQGK